MLKDGAQRVRGLIDERNVDAPRRVGEGRNDRSRACGDVPHAHCPRARGQDNQRKHHETHFDINSRPSARWLPTQSS